MLFALVLGACGATPAPPAETSVPARDRDAIVAAYLAAHGRCQEPLSERARETPWTPPDDPALQTGLIEAYETLLAKTDPNAPEHAQLLDRIAQRHVAHEQWAQRDLEQACAVDPEGASLEDLEERTRWMRELPALMQASAAGATKACARLAVLHPRFTPAARCPPP